MAREGRSVLLLDLDPQAHCALGLAVPDDQVDLSILDCLTGQLEGEPIELSRIVWQITPNLSLAPCRAALAGFEPFVAGRPGSDAIVHDLLAAQGQRYEYCIIDSPPHLGVLMRNALRAADLVIIPVDTGFFSLHGLTRQMETINRIAEEDGRTTSVRILPNQYDVRTKLARGILAELRGRFPDAIMRTTVNFNTKLKEGASFGQPITEFAPNSMGARDFQALALELLSDLERNGRTTPRRQDAIFHRVERMAAQTERLLATTVTLVGGSAAPPAGPEEGAAAGSVRATPASPATRVPRTRAPAAEAPLERPVRRAERPASEPVRLAAAAGSTGGPSSPPKDATRSRNGSAGAHLPTDPHEAIERKINDIYGVRQEADVVVFRSFLPEAEEVELAGDFNDWMPHTSPMRRLSDGAFEARLRLPAGRYRYRLVIDGHWSHHADNPRSERNEYGDLNSVLEILG
jgi:chromosome partitioning protein